MAKQLNKKPLIEAILEVRWALQGTQNGPQKDPHCKILLGRFYDRVSEQYPELEQLPTAGIPEEILGRAVQHRFRTKPNGWPLLQIGPGILTVNSTDDYSWGDFRPRALFAVSKLFELYPRPSELKITNLILRYIDAVPFDYSKDDAFKYIHDFLKVQIALPGNLWEKGITSSPKTFSWQTSHACENPAGLVTVRFASGQKNDIPAIIWETILESAGNDLPKLPDEFEKWIDGAHDITDDWFFKLIEGDLERMFS